MKVYGNKKKKDAKGELFLFSHAELCLFDNTRVLLMTVPVTESGFEFKIAEETIWRGRLEHSAETRCTLQPATEQTASELLMCICKPRYTAWLPVIMAYLCLL